MRCRISSPEPRSDSELTVVVVVVVVAMVVAMAQLTYAGRLANHHVQSYAAHDNVGTFLQRIREPETRLHSELDGSGIPQQLRCRSIAERKKGADGRTAGHQYSIRAVNEPTSLLLET